MAAKTGRKRVLIVDDEVAIGHMLSACCDMWGMEGVVASTAGEALMILAEKSPDLIVTDFMMPGMNGHEFLRIVRGNDRLRRIPIILMSAVPEAACRNSPADAFLAKPIDLDEAETMLHRWIDRRPATQRRKQER